MRVWKNDSTAHRGPGASLLLMGLAITLLCVAGQAPPALASCEHTPGMPDRILSLRETILPRGDYLRLVDDWRRYLDAHPKSALAHVQLERALRYTGSDDTKERLALIDKAYKLDPECAEAVDAMGHIKCGLGWGSDGSWRDAMKYGARAIELAPEWPEPHFSLWSLSFMLEGTEKANEHLRAIVHKGGIPSPLLDFGYNVLMSADPDAIILTNGDNDTYPPLALQALQGTREDVQIANLSLLNVPEYARKVLVGTAADPRPFTVSELQSLEKKWKSEQKIPAETIFTALLTKIVNREWTHPVYLCVTVSQKWLQVCELPRKLEGLLWRIQPTSDTPDATSDPNQCVVNVPKTDALLSTVFRMESANDFAYPWSETSAISRLMWNYIGIQRNVAADFAEVGDLEGVRRMMRRVIAMLQFHAELREQDGRDRLTEFLEYWKETDPNNPEVDALLSNLDE